MSNIRTLDVEIALAEYFNPRANLIVPNISWGMNLHECDILIITSSGYAWEVEIKVNKYDLMKDKNKRHGHNSEKIKFLYFAIPESLLGYQVHIPERAGIIIVKHYPNAHWQPYRCNRIRKPRVNSKYKFTDRERYDVARLGAIRIWNLKRKIRSLDV